MDDGKSSILSASEENSSFRLPKDESTLLPSPMSFDSHVDDASAKRLRITPLGTTEHDFLRHFKEHAEILLFFFHQKCRFVCEFTLELSWLILSLELKARSLSL